MRRFKRDMALVSILVLAMLVLLLLAIIFAHTKSVTNTDRWLGYISSVATVMSTVLSALAVTIALWAFVFSARTPKLNVEIKWIEYENAKDITDGIVFYFGSMLYPEKEGTLRITRNVHL